MKKLLSVVLAIALCFTLFTACSNNSGGTSASPTPAGESTSPVAESTTPAQSPDAQTTEALQEATNAVQQKLDNGEKVFIGFAMVTVSNPFFLQQATYLKENFGAMGVTFEYSASEGDNAQMISNIENYITMQADLIMVAPADAEVVESVLMQAESAGIPVIVMGQRPSYGDKLSGGTYVDWIDVGAEAAFMASAWIDEHYPDAGEGEIHVGILTSNIEQIYVLTTQGITDTLAQDSRIKFTYRNEDVDTIDGGYDAAAEAFTVDPDIKMFLSFQESPGIGASNYIMAQSNLNPADYAVFATGLQDMGTAQIDLSKTDESVYRGTIAYGTYGAEGVDIPSAAGLFYVTKDVLLGTAPQVPYWSADDMWSMNSFGYEKVVDYPANDFLIDLYK